MTLDEARGHVGEAVVYDGGHKREDGVITSVGTHYVFVRYRGSLHENSIATPAERLTPLAGESQ